MMTRPRESSYVHGILQLTTFTTPQSHRLAVLLKLGDELIALLDHVVVLLVLVIWTVGLDDLVDAIDSAWNTICSDEVAEIP